MPRDAADTQGGVVAGGHIVVSTFTRALGVRQGRVIARWVDGEPAASERALGRGCMREVAIPVDDAGDLALRESFRGVAESLLDPCGGARDFAPSTAVQSRDATKDLSFRRSRPMLDHCRCGWRWLRQRCSALSNFFARACARRLLHAVTQRVEATRAFLAASAVIGATLVYFALHNLHPSYGVAIGWAGVAAALWYWRGVFSRRRVTLGWKRASVELATH